MQAGKETGEKKKGYGSEQQRKCHIGERGQEKLTTIHQLTIMCITALL